MWPNGEKCDVTLPWKTFLDLKNVSKQRWPFALANDERKVWATVWFLSAIMHRKVIGVNFSLLFFSAIYICRATVC